MTPQQHVIDAQRDRIRVLAERLLFVRDTARRDALREEVRAEICRLRMLTAGRLPAAAAA